MPCEVPLHCADTEMHGRVGARDGQLRQRRYSRALEEFAGGNAHAGAAVAADLAVTEQILAARPHEALHEYTLVSLVHSSRGFVEPSHSVPCVAAGVDIAGRGGGGGGGAALLSRPKRSSAAHLDHPLEAVDRGVCLRSGAA